MASLSERIGKKGLDQSPRGIGQIGFPSAGPMRLCRRVAGVPIALQKGFDALPESRQPGPSTLFGTEAEDRVGRSP